MANDRNPAVVGGGVLLLLLWGGLGLFFGIGKGKKGDGNNNNKASQHQVPERTPPRARTQARRAVPRRATSPLVRTSVHEPVTRRDPVAPQSRRRPAPRKSSSSTIDNKHTYTYVLRLRYIHPVDANGVPSKETISLEELVKRGKQAQQHKQELHLRVRGDARARWETRIKRILRGRGVTFSVTNEF